MRKPFLMVLIVLSVVLVGMGLILLLQGSPLEPPTAATTPLAGGEVERISVQELNQQLEGSNPPVVWEFVSAEQFASGHVPGAKRMTFDNLASAAQGLDKSQAIVALCT